MPPASLMIDVNAFVNTHKTQKIAEVKVTTIPTISPVTKVVVEGLNANIQLPKSLFTLRGKIDTLEATVKKMTKVEEDLAQAEAHKIRDKIVGMLTTAGAVSVTALGVIGGVLSGGALGIILGVASVVSYAGFSRMFSQFYAFPSICDCFPYECGNSTEKIALMLGGILIPVIAAFRKIPTLKMVKDQLQAAIKEQKDIVMKDFSELFEFYRKMQLELKKFETLTEKIVKEIEAFVKQIPKKIDEIGRSVERDLLLENIRVRKQAVVELNTVQKYFQEFTKI